MAKTRSELKAGIMIVVCVGLFLAVLFSISNLGRLFQPRNHYVLSCEKVAGLEKNAPVRYAGFQCGRVTEISFTAPSGTVNGKEREVLTAPPETPAPNAWVSIEVSHDVRLRTTDEAAIKAGFTGNVYVDIVPRAKPEEGVRVLSEGAVLPAWPKTLDEVMDRADSMRGEITATTARLQSVLKKADELMPVVDNTVRRFYAAADSVDKFVVENRPKLDETVENARATTKSTRELVEESKPKIAEALTGLKETAAQASKLLEEVKPKVIAAAENMEKTTGEARERLAANRERMDQIIENFREASARLNIGMEDIRRNPWKLLSRNINADPKTQNIYDAALAFSDAARSLAEASADLKALSQSGTADTQRVQAASREVGKLVESLTEIEKEFYRSFRENPNP